MPCNRGAVEARALFGVLGFWHGHYSLQRRQPYLWRSLPRLQGAKGATFRPLRHPQAVKTVPAEFLWSLSCLGFSTKMSVCAHQAGRPELPACSRTSVAGSAAEESGFLQRGLVFAYFGDSRHCHLHRFFCGRDFASGATTRLRRDRALGRSIVFNSFAKCQPT